MGSNDQNKAECEKQLAVSHLLAELSKGVDSLLRDGGLSIDEAFEGLAT